MPPKKPKTVPGIRAREIDNKTYLKNLRRIILTPFIKRLSAQAERAQLSYDHYRNLFDQVQFDPSLEGLTEAEVKRQVKKLSSRHALAFTRSMRRHLGIDATPYTFGPEVGKVMDGVISESVSLIKTIPPRLHDSLLADLQGLTRTDGFDQSKVMDLLAKNYDSSGYNLRRLTRDQNNKLMGRLSETRQVAVGITEYVRSTAGDSRVRPSHAATEGLTYQWNSPPDIGHPGEDIQCRCTALAIIPEPIIPRSQRGLQ